jgi:hypothetical protein
MEADLLLLAAHAPVAREVAHLTMPRRPVTTRLVDATRVFLSCAKIVTTSNSAYITRSRSVPDGRSW